MFFTNLTVWKNWQNVMLITQAKYCLIKKETSGKQINPLMYHTFFKNSLLWSSLKIDFNLMNMPIFFICYHSESFLLYYIRSHCRLHWFLNFYDMLNITELHTEGRRWQDRETKISYSLVHFCNSHNWNRLGLEARNSMLISWVTGTWALDPLRASS